MKTLIACLALLVATDASAGVTTLNGGMTITPIADVTVTGSATLIKAANGNRIVLSCTNTSGSVHVRWGSSSVTSTTGQRIAAGATVEIRNIGAVYMISEGANVTMSCTEEAL